MKKSNAILTALSLFSGAVMAEPPKSTPVPYSADRDFGIVCAINGKNTYFIRKDSNNNDDRIARNIVLTDLGSGKIAISFLHGFTVADKAATYVPATNESCKTFEQ